MVILDLPFPPSVNKYWRHVKKGRFIQAIVSAQGRRYREIARTMARWQACRESPIREPVCVSIVFHPPDKRKRDLDNLPKALFDAITAAGIWADDSLVHEMHLKWGRKINGGKALVKIEILEKVNENFGKNQGLVG